MIDQDYEVLMQDIEEILDFRGIAGEVCIAIYDKKYKRFFDKMIKTIYDAEEYNVDLHSGELEMNWR